MLFYKYDYLLVSSSSNLGTLTHGWCGASTTSGGGSLESFDPRHPAWLSFTLKPPPHSCWFNLFPVLDRQPLMIISPNLVILISSICGNNYVTWSGIESLSPSLSVIPIRDTVVYRFGHAAIRIVFSLSLREKIGRGLIYT